MVFYMQNRMIFYILCCKQSEICEHFAEKCKIVCTANKISSTPVELNAVDNCSWAIVLLKYGNQQFAEKRSMMRAKHDQQWNWYQMSHCSYVQTRAGLQLRGNRQTKEANLEMRTLQKFIQTFLDFDRFCRIFLSSITWEQTHSIPGIVAVPYLERSHGSQ